MTLQKTISTVLLGASLTSMLVGGTMAYQELEKNPAQRNPTLYKINKVRSARDSFDTASPSYLALDKIYQEMTDSASRKQIESMNTPNTRFTTGANLFLGGVVLGTITATNARAREIYLRK